MRISKTRTCKDKQQHNSEGKALAALRSLAKITSEEELKLLRVYQCIFCHKWHVGHGSEYFYKKKYQNKKKQVYKIII
jgi:hypothetical protein